MPPPPLCKGRVKKRKCAKHIIADGGIVTRLKFCRSEREAGTPHPPRVPLGTFSRRRRLKKRCCAEKVCNFALCILHLLCDMRRGEQRRHRALLSAFAALQVHRLCRSKWKRGHLIHHRLRRRSPFPKGEGEYLPSGEGSSPSIVAHSATIYLTPKVEANEGLPSGKV